MAVVCFNWAVWAERSQYLPTLGMAPTRSHVVARICNRAALRVPVGKRLPGKYKEGAVVDFARAVPEGPSVAFTDGSAKPNPGPCGAGIVLRLAGSQRRTHIAIPLGFGDTNKGEMGAFYGLFATMLRLVSEGRVPLGSELIVFSDSAICVGFLLQGFFF